MGVKARGVGVAIGTGSLALSALLWEFPRESRLEAPLEAAFLGLLAFLLGHMRVPLRKGGFTSLHFLGAVAASYLLPPGGAAALAALALPPSRPLALEKEVFNRGQIALAASLASVGAEAPGLLGVVFPPLLYLVTNLTATLVLFLVGLGMPFQEARRNFVPFVLSYGALSPLALLLARSLEKAFLTGSAYLDALLVTLGGLYVYDLWKKTKGLEEAALASLETAVRLLEARDAYTALHSERVAAIARSLGEELGLPPYLLERLEVGARLHDVGKVAIPDAVLRKPGKLSPEEEVVVQEHPQAAVKALAPLLDLLGREVLEIAQYHHERWDGSGYPKGSREKRSPCWPGS